MATRPVGSCGCHVQVPSAVPSSSRYVTTMNAPTYSSRDRPHSRKPTRQPYQNAPSTSRRSLTKSPQPAYAPPITSVATTSGRAYVRNSAHRPSVSAHR